MSEFKISLGFDIEENSKAKIQDIIDEINAKKPEITVKVNTEQALKDIKTLQKELKKLKDINIKINTKTNQSGTRNKNTNTNANESVTKNQLSTNVNKVSWKKVDKNTNSKSSFNSDADDVEKLKVEIEQATIAYSKMLKIAKELKKHRITLEGLNISKNSREYEIVESEIQRLLISYEQLKNENKEFLKYIPDDRLKKIFEETRFEVNKLKASMEDTSEFKEIAFNFDMLRDKAKEIGQIKGKLIDLDVEKNASEITFLTQRLEELQKEYNDLLNTFRNKLSAENLIELSNIGYKSDINIERLNAKGYDVKNKVANSISDNISTKYKSDIDNIATSMIKLSNVSTELRTEFSQLQAIYNNMSVAKLNGDTEQLIGLNDEYVRTLSKVKTELKQVQNSQRTGVNISNLDFSKTKLKNDIDIWLKKNSASAKEFGATMENIKSRIQSADKITLNNLQKEFREVKQEAELAGKTGLSFGDSIKEQFKRMTSYFTLYDVYSYSKRAFTSMFNEVKNVDTAMSGLYRVTDLTTSQYNEMYNGMTESAKQYGLVLSELIDGTTTWAKLGFDGQIASQLGEVSARYQVVADTDAETAVTNLVTAYKGFQDELLDLYNGDSVKAVEYVSDIFNKLGNEYAIDAEKIGIALTKSASALSISGASIQEASGMITGISEITGNPERASNALKIVSMRLRGMTGDLEELGEEVDDDVKSISQMQTKILNFTHGKVNIFDDAGEFRNIYDIFDDIADIYFDLTSTEQAGLLETIAGKNRSSDIVALLRGWKQVEKATQSAYNAEGSAMDEYSIHLDTVQASLNTLSSTWQEFSNIFLNSKFLKSGIDTLSNLLDLLGELIDTFGVLPTLLGGLSIVGSFKNKGLFKLIEDDATISGKRIENTFSNTFSNIKTLMSDVKNPYAFSDVFSTNLNNDIVSLNKYIKAVSQGESKNVALANYMQMSSNSAKEYASSIDVSTLATKNASEVMDICSSSTKEFETQQKMAQISLVANGNSLTKTKQLIDEYQGGLKNCGMSQQQFLTAVQATNPQLANYLSGIKNGNASLKGYIGSLIKAKSATILLEITTTALNMAITMGLSVAISALVSKIDELYVSEEEARKQAEEDLQVANEQVEKNKERVNSLDELIKKYKELSNGDNSPKTRSEILNVQKEIVSLVGEEAYNLDLVGGKLDENLSKLKEYRKNLLEEKSNSILDKLNKTQDKNQKNKGTEKITTFNSGYDLTGEISYDDYRILEKSKIDFNSKSFTNRVKVGFASDVNEFTKKEIKSTADALKYYKQVREEWIKTYSKDKKISKSGAEFELSNNSLFKNLDKKIQELKNQVNEERQLAQEYIDEQFTGLSEYDNELSKIKVKSADDYQDYVEKFTKKILDNKNIKQFIKDGYFSEDDIRKGVENYISGLDQIGAYTDNWKKKYKNIETNIIFNKESLDKVKSDIETFYSAIEESMSNTGLTDDTINNIQAMFSELDGYDASKLFERTAVGIKLNRTELEKLQEQYDIQNKSAIHSNLRDLLIEYDDLKKKISECTDEEKKAELQSQLDSKEDEINQVKNLASQYDALTSAYYKWIKAQSTPNEGDAYDSFTDNLSKVAEIYKKGMIGTDDFQTSVQMMTNEDLSGKTAQEIAKVYQEKLPTVKKFFKEGTTGCENFLKSVEALNKGWAKQNKDGSWEFNFDNEKLAKELGISVDLVELLLDKLKGLGFNVDLDYALDDIDSLNKLAKDANKTLKDLDKTDTSFSFNTKDINVANSEIDKAQKLLDKFKNDDGTIDLRLEGASEAQTVLTALIKNRQELEKPSIMNVKLDESELQTNYGKAVKLIQDLNNQADDLEINFKTGRDTSTTKKNIQKTIKDINSALDKLSEKDKLKLNADIDIDDIKKRLSYIDANIKAGVDVSDKDIELIKTVINQVNPEIDAKVKVDDKEVENFKKKDKNTKSTHKVKVDDKEVKKYKKTDHSLKSILTYGLVKSFELSKLIKHPPKLESVIVFSAVTKGISSITTQIKNALNGGKKDKDSKKGSKKGKGKKGKGSVDGTAHVNGSAYASGSAFANGKSGDWRVGSSGKALVGELGEELKISNGKWELIGSDSAEFIDVDKNDIIFNAEQTRQLFKYGKIINGKTRGRTLASGSAFAEGTISGMAFGEGTGKFITSGKTKKKKTTKSGSSTKSKSKSKSSTSSKSKSKSSSSSSSSAEKTKETFDWIEIAIERIENAISDLDKIAESVYYSFSTRNTKLRKEYSMVRKEISLQEKAYTRYMKEANSVGLSSKYKKLVQNGKISISTITDDGLKEKIQNYQTWYNKAQNVKDAIADLKLEMRNLRKELFDNISTEYDNYVGRLEKQKTYIENYISRSESKSMTVSTKYYDALINNEKTSLTKLKAERKNLLDVLNTGLKKGDLAKGSDAWYEMQGKIDDVTESIQMCTNNIIDFQNEIRQIKWDNFDYLHETISQISDESDFLIDLFSNKDLFDDKGNITNYGTSTLGLRGMNYNVFMQQSQSYAREIERLNKEIAKTPNDKELISRRNDLIKSQQEMIQSAMSEKQAMIDLVRDGYDLQLDSLQDLIDKYNEAFESQKNLYEYNKKVQDQTKNIAKLEKELSAYQNDTTEETKAKVQQLKISLEEAKDNLKETEYDKYISDQQDLLDNMYSEYEDFIDSKFENVDALFSDLISNVNSNSSTVNETISSESEKVGYTLSDSMESIWGNTGDVLSDFSSGFSEFSGKFDTYAENSTNNIETWLSTINSNLVAMANASNTTATSDIKKATSNKYTANASKTTTTANKTTTSKNKSTNKNKKPSTSKSKTAGYISGISATISSKSSSSYIKKVQTALKNLGFKGKDKKTLTVDGIWGTNTDYAVNSFQKINKYGGAIKADGIIGKNTKAKFKKAGYKKGIYNLKQNELAWTQEDNKQEVIIRKSDGAILTPLLKGDSVLNNNATSNLWDMTNNPSKFINDNLASNVDISNGNNISNGNVNNEINMNITLPNVKNYNEFVSQLQKDSKFERMIQDMTVNQLSGKSSLNKFRHKFK